MSFIQLGADWGLHRKHMHISSANSFDTAIRCTDTFWGLCVHVLDASQLLVEAQRAQIFLFTYILRGCFHKYLPLDILPIRVLYAQVYIILMGVHSSHHKTKKVICSFFYFEKNAKKSQLAGMWSCIVSKKLFYLCYINL